MTDLSRIIAAGVGPIIVISACGLLCLAFYNRLSTVVTRLRSFHRERLHELEALARLKAAGSGDRIALVRHQELVGMLEVQTHHVTRRARLIRATLTCLLLTIGMLALCSLAVGLAALWPAFMYVAVPAFIAGLVLLITAIGFGLLEVRAALDPIEIETRFVTALAQTFERLSEPGGSD